MKGIQGPKKSLERRIQGPRVTQPVHVSPTLFLGRAGDKAGWAEPPYPPQQGIPLPQVNYPSRTSLGGNLTSASKFGSEVIVLTQDERGERFWLFGTSLRGQAAELETHAGQPRAYHLSSAWRNQAGPVQPEPIHGRPVRGKSWYKEDHCTSFSLSNNTRRWQHLQTHRAETLPTRSEEEQTVVKTCRTKS